MGSHDPADQSESHLRTGGNRERTGGDDGDSLASATCEKELTWAHLLIG